MTQPATDSHALRNPARVPRIAAAVFVVGAYSVAAGLTWERWGDIIIDCGRELDTPKQLAAGKMLYRDVRYWYGPLAPYLNAALFKVFGVKVSTLTTAGLFSAALLTWLAYRTTRLFTGRTAAAVTAAAVIFINCFGHLVPLNIFQFPLPYAYPATYGVVSGVASLFFLLRHIHCGRSSDFILSCACLSLTSLCKLEILAAAMFMHGLFLVGRLFIGLPKRLVFLLGYLAALIVPTCTYAHFYNAVGSGLWSDNLLIQGNLSAKEFLLMHSGLLNVGASLRDVAWSAGGFLACLVVVWGGAAMEARFCHAAAHAEGNFRAAGITIGVLAGSACSVLCWLLGFTRVFRVLPFLLAFLLIVECVLFVRKSNERTRRLTLIILFGFALVPLARMMLRTVAGHYGFYLLVPGLIAWGVFWCGMIPVTLAVKPLRRSRSAYVAAVLMMAAITFTHANATRETAAFWYGPGDPIHVRTASGSIPCVRVYQQTVDEAVRFLSELPPTTTVVVIPEGVAITFLAGLSNALGAHTFLPVDFCGGYDDAAMTHRLQAAAPEYVVLNSRDVQEYGARGIGVDYGMQVASWISANYGVVRDFRTDAFRVVVFKRK